MPASRKAAPIITLRGILLGALTAAAMLYYVVVVGQGIGAGRYVNSQFPMTAFMPFVLWLFVNVLLKRVWPSQALSRGELLTILTMVWVVGILYIKSGSALSVYGGLTPWYVWRRIVLRQIFLI